MHNLNKDTEIYFDVYFLQIINDIYIFVSDPCIHLIETTRYD